MAIKSIHFDAVSGFKERQDTDNCKLHLSIKRFV